MPPDPVTVTLPSEAPLHKTIVGTPIEADTAVGSVIVSLSLKLHPFPSVTVTDINPAGKLETEFVVAIVFKVVCPLLHE